jgi:hypothetical protein
MLAERMARDGGFGGYGGAPKGGYNAPPPGPHPLTPTGFGPPGGVPPLGGPMTPGSGPEVDTSLPLLLSIAATLLCCNPVLGLPAIVLAIQARNAANMGSADVARRRARAALVLSLVAAGAGLLFELFEGFRYVATTSAAGH